jgi:hypothetical protein
MNPKSSDYLNVLRFSTNDSSIHLMYLELISLIALLIFLCQISFQQIQSVKVDKLNKPF